MSIEITRRLEIDAGHRVVGHEGKCASWHGHRWAIEFTVTAEKLDEVGRVIDFGVIKAKLGTWLDKTWDHAMILWDRDKELVGVAKLLDGIGSSHRTCVVPVNPTSENLAEYLLRHVAPEQLQGTGVHCVAVTIHETPNCRASARLSEQEIATAVRHATSRRKTDPVFDEEEEEED